MQASMYGAALNDIVAARAACQICVPPDLSGVAQTGQSNGLHACACACRRLVLPPYCVRYEPPRSAQNPVTRGVQEGVRQFIALGNRIKGRARRRGKARWAAGA